MLRKLYKNRPKILCTGIIIVAMALIILWIVLFVHKFLYK